MEFSLPFFSNDPEAAGPGIFHSHPRCRIAQGIATEARVAGVGESRSECPFCYLLGQFQTSRNARYQRPASQVAELAGKVSNSEMGQARQA